MLLPEDDKPPYLNGLGTFLSDRFERLGDIGDIEESFILVLREALSLHASNNLGKWEILRSLGVSLLRRFDRCGDVSDMEESVVLLKQALGILGDGHR